MLSPSSRRAWIEITLPGRRPRSLFVALLAEGVDRNMFWRSQATKRQKSPSSRRAWIEIFLLTFIAERYIVALLAEGVDRNKVSFGGNIAVPTSPSSRRAWIEILDRDCRKRPGLSPSSRRAWIEIRLPQSRSSRAEVALLAEGVDRNRFTQSKTSWQGRRPPRGGRG